jgi:hypothetical protein
MPADRIARIVEVYLQGELELDTAVAELTHVYVEHGWGFYLVDAECAPQHRERMRALAARMEAAMSAATGSQHRGIHRGAAEARRTT